MPDPTKEEYERYINDLREQLKGREDERHRAVVDQSDATKHQNELIRGKDRRIRLERFGRSLGTVDGSSREALRRWIDGVDYAQKWVGATDLMVLELIGALVGGALASHLLSFKEQCQNAVPAKEMTWDAVKAEIKKSFLDNDEEEFLREVVDRTRQQPYEDTRAYAHRYLEAIRKAYTADDLKVALTQERLIKRYISGLSDVEVRRQVHLSRPTTLEDAAAKSHSASRAFSLAETRFQDDRDIEPMEIGRIDLVGGTQKAAAVAPLQAQIDKLQGELKRVNAELKRVRKSRPMLPSQPTTGRRKDTRRCFGCHKRGHILMNCPTVEHQSEDAESVLTKWQNNMEAQISAINDILSNPKN